MSGRQKRVFYAVYSIVLALCAVAGTALLLAFGVREGGPLDPITVPVWIAVGAAVAVAVLLPLNLIVHELGHTFFGLIAGLRPVCVQIGYFTIYRGGVRLSLNNDVSGMSALLARNRKNLREKMITAAIGGMVFNFLYVAITLPLWFCLPSPATLFFALLAPINLYEGLAALFPIQRQSGATDGALFVGLVKKQPFAEVMLGVLKAQSALVTGTFAGVKREWLFGVPVIREDDPLFSALTQLRWQYLFSKNDEKGAIAQLRRLDDIFEYTENPDLACDLAYAYSVLLSDDEKAETYFQKAKGAKGSLSYAVAAAACGHTEIGAACERAERETWKGLRDLGFRLIERIPHVI